MKKLHLTVIALIIGTRAFPIDPDSTRGWVILLLSHLRCCHMDINRFITVTDDLPINVFQFCNLD